MKEKDKKRDDKGTDKKLLSRKNIKIGLVAAGVIVFLATYFLVLNLRYNDKIFPNTIIANANVGGMTQDKAEAAIEEAIKSKADQKITIILNDKKTDLNREVLGVKYDAKASVNLAWEIGRKGNFWKVLKDQTRIIFGGNNTHEAVFSYDNSKLDAILNDFSQSLPNPLKETTVVMDGLTPSVQTGQPGQAVDEGLATQEVENFFGLLESTKDAKLTTLEAKPRVSAEEAQKTLEQVQKILANDYQIKASDKNFTLKTAELAPWLEFTPTKNFWTRNWSLSVDLKKDKLSGYVSWLAGQVDREAKDAKFQMTNGRVTAFQTSQTGLKLDQEKTKEQIADNIKKAVTPIEVAVSVVEPNVSSSASTTVGIKELVAEGKTSWRGSPKNRIHNLTLGANKISGTLVKPGDEFSTVKAISPITAEAGFLPELVIKNSNEVEPEIGGGLCQVSTTLFRAVLNAGLQITERDNHSFRVSYYEPPVGMDATIYDPKPDFRFINNMKTPILIWAMPTDYGLSFQIYGTKDGRQVSISDPVLYNYVSPGEPIYKVKENMGPEDIRQVERATRGVTAKFEYKVTAKDGSILEKDTFISKYVPIADTYFVGPGYPIPPPAPTE